MSAPGPLLARIYGVICLVAIAYAGYRFIFAPANSELAGVPLVVLGLPWTLVMTPIALMVGGPASAFIIAGGVIGGCALNVWLLNRIGARRGTS